MSTFTTGGDRRAADIGRAVVLVRNDTAQRRAATVVIDGERRTTRQADLAPGEVGVVAAPAAGPVVAAVHTESASASFSFDPATAAVPPLFSVRSATVLVSPE